MRRTIAILGLAFTLLFLAAEQRPTFAQQITEKPIGCAFDSYGEIRSCDHSARLDNFAIQLQNTPDGTGYILIYAPASAFKRIRDPIVDYLVNSRGIARERITTHHAGYNSVPAEPRIQLWIVPEGAEFPEPEKSNVDLEAIKGKFAEFQGWDNIELVGPGFEAEDDSGTLGGVGSVVYEAFADVFKAQKNSIAHVIGFDGAKAVPGAWRRVAESTVEDLKKFGFESSRFKISYGGQAKETKVQLWILPKGESPPIKAPRSEPPPKAVQIGEFDAEALGIARNEVAVFDRLSAVMGENPGWRVCLIVRMEAAVPEEVIEASEETEEIERAELPKLVEKWKSELAAKHKIRQDRIVVLFANAHEYRASSLEVWVVPPDQPLPNPDARESQPSDVVQDPQRRP